MMIVLVMCALQTYFITCIFSGSDKKDAVTDTHFTKLRAKQMKEQQKAVFKDDDDTVDDSKQESSKTDSIELV